VTELEQRGALLAQQNNDMQQQVRTASKNNVKQCEDLQGILAEAQVAIQQLRAEKVCA
jgi:hypothetical protein